MEFFGVDFGVKKADVCTDCGSEYLSQEVMEDIEEEIKKRGLYGLERMGRVAKSGNSLVIRIPKDIADTLKIEHDTPIIIYPSERKKLVIEIRE